MSASFSFPSSSSPSSPSSRSIGQTLRRNLVNPVALGYLAIVAAVCAWVAVDAIFVDHADASLAGVWIFLVTAPTSFLITGPTSLLFVNLPDSLIFIEAVVGILGIAASAFVQALLLGLVYRWFTGRAHRTGTSGSA